MIYSRLADDILISKVCFGCEPLGGTDWGEVDIDAIAGAIDRALDIGINFFDTADVYGLGRSEERLSKILGPRRHEIVIATKGGVAWENKGSDRAIISKNSSPKYLRKAIEASCKRLRIDRIPIYYVHWPDSEHDIRYTFEFLSRMQEEDKIGLLACSNFTAKQLSEASEVANVSLIQIPVNLLDSTSLDKIGDVAKREQVGVVAYNVLATGLLSGKYGKEDRFPQSDRRSRLPLFEEGSFLTNLEKVEEVKVAAEANGIKPAQYAIRWVLEQELVVSAITGIKSEAQITENAQTIDLPLAC